MSDTAREPAVRRILTTDKLNLPSRSARPGEGRESMASQATNAQVSPSPRSRADGAGAAIRTIDLRKTYSSAHGDVLAVDGIDLEVAHGEFFGLLGPNGAGKSTTIGMLTTLVVPSGGQAFVAGVDVVRDPVDTKRRIGMASQNNTLDRQLTVAENLEYRGRFFGMSSRQAKSRADDLLDLFNLGERRKAMVYELSGGQAKRVMIGRALVHRPEILFLDEPTAGIDPQTRVNLWDALRELHRDGQTIILTTHHMEEAEQLCRRIAIVDHGKVLACDTLRGLQDSVGADTVVTVTYGEGSEKAAARAREVPGVNNVETADGQVRVFTRDADGMLGRLLDATSADGLSVRDATVLRPGLESVFLSLTGREYRE